MPELYAKRRQTIGELLNTKGLPIVVPEWQRNYSWDRTEVECFWLDLQAFSERYPGARITGREYFFGSVLLAQYNNTLVLLDGQNRVASAMILLSVIRDCVSQSSSYDAARIQQKYIRDFSPATGSANYKLTLNRYDQAFFQQEIQDAPAAGRPTPEPLTESHRLIRQARSLLLDRMEKQGCDSGNGKAGLAAALRIQKVLTDHTVVMTSLSKWTARMRLPVNHPD